ncbi:MAG: transcriptional regulator [Ktedonobacteraceae bacterium]
MKPPDHAVLLLHSAGDVYHETQPTFDLDRLIHEPARLSIVAVLDAAEEVDFKFLLHMTGLTKGNLSRQTEKLEEAGYIDVRKYYKGRVPATGYRLAETGRIAFGHYREQMMRLLRPPLPEERQE